MWVINSDTGKWYSQSDNLSKDNFEKLRQDLQSVRLYSKCLSGAVYIMIDDFDNIYNTLDYNKIGFYVDASVPGLPLYGVKNTPPRGPLLSIDTSTYNDFYNKYLKDYAFTIKNLFTPSKLINTESENIRSVDYATTESIKILSTNNIVLIIDGQKLIEGNRVLVKNQTTKVTLASSVDVENYFTNINPASEYTLVQNNGLDRVYSYFNNENGIYKYVNGILVKESDLSDYDSIYKLSVFVHYGDTNKNKQFHLQRLLNDYFPEDTQNKTFKEGHNWILRHRLDYNNVLDLNHYDLLKSESTQVYSLEQDFTYTIPERLIAVGEFGSIICNQDKLSDVATYSNSTIVNSKYKVNLRAVTETNDYYWVCGDEGTLLKIYKPNLDITRIELNTFNQLTSISFFDNLNGFVVGKFNTIFYTQNGGKNWNKLDYPEFDSYSYNKVKYFDLNKVYVCGEVGLFLELTRDANSWQFYKRKIYKTLDGQNYDLVDDIFDMIGYSWTTVKEFNYVLNDESLDLADSMNINIKSSEDDFLQVKITFSTKYEEFVYFKLSNFGIQFTIVNSIGTIIYQDTSDSIFSNNGQTNYSLVVDLPDDGSFKLKNDSYTVTVDMVYNFDGVSNEFSPSPLSKQFQFDFSTTTGDCLILTSYDKVVIYDYQNKFYGRGNDFIFYEFNQSPKEIKSISKYSQDLNDTFYIGADRIYSFNFRNISNFTKFDENVITGNLTLGTNLFVNKILAKDKLHICGNESLLKWIEYNSFGQNAPTYFWDPTFKDKLKPKLLFLDYDIASKLNFFTDLGEYRLPTSCTFSESDLLSGGQNAFFEVKSLSNETSWVDYYKDAEKSFEYYTFMGESKKVEFSTTFSYHSISRDFTLTGSDISTNLDDVKILAPSMTDSKFSDFFEGDDIIIQDTSDVTLFPTQPTTLSNYKLLIYKNVLIIKRGFGDDISVGDILRIESDVVDANILVNKVLLFQKQGANPFFRVNSFVPAAGNIYEKYVYCFVNFNQNMTTGLKSSTNIKFTNLNKYNDVPKLIDNIQNHPISIGYKISKSSDIISVSGRFNNKTAYYNLAASILTYGLSKNMEYKETFMNFGFSPTYNLLDNLNRLNPSIFSPNKKFTILPEYIGLPGVTEAFYNQSNIKVDFSNKIVFGEDFKFHWETFIKWTFVDITCFSGNGDSRTTNSLLIINKYYDEDEPGYVIEFHKKIKKPSLIFGFDSVNIRSRNQLNEISIDLQNLNNIQRTKSEKSLNSADTFYSYESDVKLKFPTDSYAKTLLSDYDIRTELTGIVYTDYNQQIALNIINVEKNVEYEYNSIQSGVGGFPTKTTYALTTLPQNEFKVGDLIFIDLTGATGSSKDLNPYYRGMHTILEVSGQYITTTTNYGQIPQGGEYGTIRKIRKDEFLNYLPVDLYDLGSDKKPNKAIEILPEMISLGESKVSLVGVDTSKFKLKFVDGLFLQDIEEKYPWFLEAETSNGVVGQNESGLIWYSGVWRCGRWFGGTWISGEWLGGDWYDGKWYSSDVSIGSLSAEINNITNNPRASRWQNGRWFGGDWYGGSWYDGRRYSGDWYGGIWYNGIWNDGSWYGGSFQGGVWVNGFWDGGSFNCDSRSSYWLDGEFHSGDFGNGIWYNGKFGNNQDKLVRFGTKSVNTRVSIWHGGKWIGGEFHSLLNQDTVTGAPIVSDTHSLSVWKTGLWLGGDFYGGIAYNIDFRGGIWHGGILEDIQVTGLEAIYPAITSKNSLIINGLFKFNTGDEIWIVDDFKGGDFSAIGSNDSPKSYRINKILEDEINNQTYLYLNYRFSDITPTIPDAIGLQDFSNIETNLRIVSRFIDSTWKSGHWRNGIFENGEFESGVWYNGNFEGNWGK